MKNYYFLGAPGVGKGTLSAKLEKDKGVKHISTGEIFRENIKNETPIGLKVKSILAEGKYVTNDITNEIVDIALSTDYVKEHGFLLDGYPRNMGQVEYLEENGFDIDVVVLLNAPDQVVIDRLVARARGADDTPEVIKKRLEVYNKETKPLIEYYKNKGILVEVDASGTIEQCYANLLEAIA